MKLTKKSTDFSAWYNEIVQRAELADYSPIRGCMVIRPYGYAIWELMRSQLDTMFRETGHENAYFPLLIPESFFEKESEHIEGFAPECATVTHGGGKKLEENLYIRPTSETIIYAMYAKWVKSYRDLPLKYNQWANVVRWEMRTRLFLRTMEFLWQEGHTAHATHEEAHTEALQMLDVYTTFAEKHMALPVIKGYKTDKEKFAGALQTYCIQAMMGDKKGLQAGTSHDLGQNFAKAFQVRFQDQDGKMEYVWSTSWGVSTRLIGALIMAHGDDKGLVLPPRLAPKQVVVIPIVPGDEKKVRILETLTSLIKPLESSLRIHVDDREQYSPGWKFNDWEMRGVPLRLELGPRDLEAEQVILVRRDTGKKESCPFNAVIQKIPELLDDIQSNLFNRHKIFMDDNTVSVDTYDDFRTIMREDEQFILAHWNGDWQIEDKIQDETKATINVVPFTGTEEQGRCMVTGEPSERRVVFAKTY